MIKEDPRYSKFSSSDRVRRNVIEYDDKRTKQQKYIGEG